MAEDDIVHIIDDPGEQAPEQGPRWKIAVIDDEPAVHDGTRFALSDYRLNGQGLDILSAYSAAEGRELMRNHPDVAVVLLDVIMETDTAGLDLVEFIRNELKNETVRIILRTGQPGQAPERRVIVDYDINDYKAKTELTADKLFTALTAALRSHQQLERMVETRRGLSSSSAWSRPAAGSRSSSRRPRPCSTSSRCSASPRACSRRSPRCSRSIAPASWSCARR
jgi:CheY-like chemotaxis protein